MKERETKRVSFVSRFMDKDKLQAVVKIFPPHIFLYTQTCRPGEEKKLLVRASDIKMREVINISDGRRLGVVEDWEMDLETGAVRAIIVPGSPRFLWFFGHSDDIVIPWEKIRKIGHDVILVDADGCLGKHGIKSTKPS